MLSGNKYKPSRPGGVRRQRVEWRTQSDWTRRRKPGIRTSVSRGRYSPTTENKPLKQIDSISVQWDPPGGRCPISWKALVNSHVGLFKESSLNPKMASETLSRATLLADKTIRDKYGRVKKVERTPLVYRDHLTIIVIVHINLRT